MGLQGMTFKFKLTCMDAPRCSMASTLSAQVWKLPGGDEYPEGASRFRSRATSGPASASDSGALYATPPPPPGSLEEGVAMLEGPLHGPELAEASSGGGTVSLIEVGGASPVVP